MKLKIPEMARRRTLPGLVASALAATVAAALVVLSPSEAVAIATPVPLATAASFSVLAGQGVTNTGPTVISHDLGTHPNPAITGFPPGQVLGAVHAADAVALQAKSDLVTAYNNAAGQAQDFALAAGIGNGTTLLPGVYKASSGVGLTGDLILDAGGNPNSVWVFQIPEALTTATASRVLLTNGASPCNVYWQVGSSATLGTTSTFVGTIMALTDIHVTTGTNIEGRALARNGAVTLDNNRIFLNSCSTGTTGGTTTGSTTGTTAGVIGGGLVSGGLLGGPIVSVTGGAGAGSTSGNTAGNNVTSGNTSGNTAGNTSGNTAGNTAGRHGGKPGEHGGKPGEHGGPKHGGGPGYNGQPGDEHQGAPGKPDHGHGGPDENNGHDYGDYADYGYGNAPKSDGQEGHEG